MQSINFTIKISPDLKSKLARYTARKKGQKVSTVARDMIIQSLERLEYQTKIRQITDQIKVNPITEAEANELRQFVKTNRS